MDKKFKQKIGDNFNPFKTKLEAIKFAEGVRKHGRRAIVKKSGLYSKSRGFHYQVIIGQKRR